MDIKTWQNCHNHRFSGAW